MAPPPLRDRLNRLLTGRSEYFRFSHTAAAHLAVVRHVAMRARRFLCRRQVRVSGTSRFGYAKVFGKAGVIDIHQKRLQRSPVHALS